MFGYSSKLLIHPPISLKAVIKISIERPDKGVKSIYDLSILLPLLRFRPFLNLDSQFYNQNKSCLPELFICTFGVNQPLMKIMLFVLTLCTGFSYSQVSKTQDHLEYEIVGVGNRFEFPVLKKAKDGHYIISYYNQKYPHLKIAENLSFTASDSELECLYQTLKEQFNKADYSDIDLDPYKLYLVTFEKYVTVMAKPKTGFTIYFRIYPDELDQLFGKT